MTPGPIVLDTETFLTYTPFAAGGLARTIWSMNAVKFVSSASMPNDTLPIGACTLPALSTRNSILPAFVSRTALRDVERHRARLRVRHEPARTEHAAERAELAHLVRRGDQHVEVEPAVLDLLDELRADEIGAGVLGLRALSPTAMTSTRTDLPVPAGSTTVPRTT